MHHQQNERDACDGAEGGGCTSGLSEDDGQDA
jgi:hypothetical protein